MTDLAPQISRRDALKRGAQGAAALTGALILGATAGEAEAAETSSLDLGQEFVSLTVTLTADEYIRHVLRGEVGNDSAPRRMSRR